MTLFGKAFPHRLCMNFMIRRLPPDVRRSTGFTAVALIVCFFVASCDRATEHAAQPDRAGNGSTGRVTAYVSVDDAVALPILERFERDTGITVLFRGDTEATKTTGLVRKLFSEQSSPRADVFWSSEVFGTIELARAGVLAPYAGEAIRDWPPSLRDAEGRWHAFALRARVIVFNSQRIQEKDAPRTLHDLLRDEFRGRIAMARPQFGTTRGHMGFLAASWGEDRLCNWLRGMKNQQVALLDGNSTVVRMVASGSYDVGLTDTDDVWAGQRNGWPVDLVYVRHDLPPEAGGQRIGPLLIPNTVALVAGGPHPDEGRRLVEFLLSPEVERMLAESDSHNIPIRADLAREFSAYAVPDPVIMPYDQIAAHVDRAVSICEHELGP